MWSTLLENILVCVAFLPVTVPTPTGLDQCEWKLFQVSPYVSIPCEAGPVYGRCGLQIGKEEKEIPLPLPE